MRREFIAGSLAAAALTAAPRRRPNILLILVDDLGYGDLGCYGGDDLRTPRLDRLAGEGLRFTHCYSNSPVCSPTRAALLSGRFPERVGVPGVIRTHGENSWGHLTPESRLLPELLAGSGYERVHIGKWHLGLASPNLPTERGFDHFHGWLGDMMDDYWSHRRHEVNYLRRGTETIDPPGHATELFTQWTLDWLRQRDRSRPFCCYLCYNAPHAPIQPPPEWLERVRARAPELDERRAKMVALIEHLDDAVGRLLDGLDEVGARDETLVVFVSDNGGDLPAGASCGNLRDGKGTLYEGGLRVPAMARWPGVIAPGRVSDHVALTMDLCPTALELAGAAVPDDLDGRSLLPLLAGDETPRAAQDLFWTRLEGSREHPAGWTTDGLRRGPWKLLRPRHDRPYELYRLDHDPLEQQNQIDAEPAVAAELLAALRAQLAAYAEVPWRRPA